MLELHIYLQEENKIKGDNIILHFFPAIVLLDEPHTELKEKVWGTNVRERGSALEKFDLPCKNHTS